MHKFRAVFAAVLVIVLSLVGGWMLIRAFARPDLVEFARAAVLNEQPGIADLEMDGFEWSTHPLADTATVRLRSGPADDEQLHTVTMDRSFWRLDWQVEQISHQAADELAN